MRTWALVGSRVFAFVRRYPLALPLRLWWSALDRAIFAWWWWGQEDAGAYRWRWYRHVEDAFSGFWLALYVGLWAWIYRNVGE